MRQKQTSKLKKKNKNKLTTNSFFPLWGIINKVVYDKKDETEEERWKDQTTEEVEEDQHASKCLPIESPC